MAITIEIAGKHASHRLAQINVAARRERAIPLSHEEHDSAIRGAYSDVHFSIGVVVKGGNSGGLVEVAVTPANRQTARAIPKQNCQVGTRWRKSLPVAVSRNIGIAVAVEIGYRKLSGEFSESNKGLRVQ